MMARLNKNEEEKTVIEYEVLIVQAATLFKYKNLIALAINFSCNCNSKSY